MAMACSLADPVWPDQCTKYVYMLVSMLHLHITALNTATSSSCRASPLPNSLTACIYMLGPPGRWYTQQNDIVVITKTFVT